MTDVAVGTADCVAVDRHGLLQAWDGLMVGPGVRRVTPARCNDEQAWAFHEEGKYWADTLLCTIETVLLD